MGNFWVLPLLHSVRDIMTAQHVRECWWWWQRLAKNIRAGSERNTSARPAVGNPKGYNACTYLLHWNCTSELYTFCRNRIPQTACMVGTNTSKGRVKKSTLENTLSHPQSSKEVNEFTEFTIIGHNTWMYHFSPQTRQTRKGNTISESPTNSKDASVRENYVVCMLGCRKLPMLNWRHLNPSCDGVRRFEVVHSSLSAATCGHRARQRYSDTQIVSVLSLVTSGPAIPVFPNQGSVKP